MRFVFSDAKIEALYTEQKGRERFGKGVVDNFFDVMSIIDAAPDIREFNKIRGLNFERLKGDRKHQYSLRLNRQWRLIFMIEEDEEGNFLLIIGIEDYH